ncbi:MAG: N-acetylmuramoyl-L-alanine amidase [Brachybacterium sp.]|uniref:peptidoglycan recognition protein family protein n=1 Tax=Brachybacterium sp. TaxID=1891286 RepID=UPI0026498119|nr:peptidoglycan recognition family protein [Brachybacterium sp.]MDN5686454.1 N-acetylmuramoyl-L-alanine amidase [Brachybacterium sp.]
MARAYNYITSKTSPNQSSRKGRDISSITIHWWGNPVGQKIGGIVSWLCDRRARTSAHYVVSGDTVYCIVDPDRKAWHSGSNTGNYTSIGLELDPNASMRAGTERTAAALIADLRAFYGNLPLYPHRHWVSTECPGNWSLSSLDRLAKGTKPGVPVGPAGGTSVPVTKPAAKGELIEDGRFGHATVEDLQKYLNKFHDAGIDEDGKAGHSTWKAFQHAVDAPYADGEISRQSYRAEELGNGITQGWHYTGRGSEGSQTIELMQHWVGADVDGILFEGTTKALQRKLNTYEL